MFENKVLFYYPDFYKHFEYSHYFLSTKTKVGGKYVVLKDSTKYAPHSKRSSVHTADMRIVNGGSGKAKIEGNPIARKGDSIADGDTINEGFDKVNVGG